MDYHNDRRGPSRPTQPTKVYVRPQPPVRVNTAAHRAVEWLAARGISAETAKHFGLVPTTRTFKGEQMDAIAIPIYRDGVLVNTKYRSLEGKHFGLESQAEVCFYGLDDIDPSSTVKIVEGEMDRLACYEAGIDNVLSVPNGAPAPGTMGNFEYLDAAMPILSKCDSFILATDGDGPGSYLADELARRLGPARCRRVVWPDGVKDANECLLYSGGNGLFATLAESEPYPVEGIVEPIRLMDQYERYRKQGLEPGLSIGIPAMAHLYAVIPGQLTVIYGVPSHGKSAFVDQVAVNMAREHGWMIGVYTPENDPPERYMGELAAKYIGKPFRGGPTEPMTEAEARESALWINDHFRLLRPERPTLSELLDKAATCVAQYGLSGLILDPWNEIETQVPSNALLTNYIGQCLQQIKAFGAKHRVHIWVCAHPKKMPFVAGKPPELDPYTIADSAMFFNKADVIILVKRDTTVFNSPTRIVVQKIRQREAGQLGEIDLYYDPPTGIFR